MFDASNSQRTPPGRAAAASGAHAERDELLTATEVAELLRMTRAWVYAETRLDHIPHLRLGRYFRYRRTTIESWIAELETHQAEARGPRGLNGRPR